MRMFLYMVFVSSLLLLQVVNAKPNLGNGYDELLGTCELYNGTYCADYASTYVYIIPGKTQAEIEEDIITSMSLVSIYGSPECIASSKRSNCIRKLSTCNRVDIIQNSVVTSVVFPTLSCKSVCMESWDSCRSLYESAMQMNRAEGLASCGVGNDNTYGMKDWSDPSTAGVPDSVKLVYDVFPHSMGEIPAYPESESSFMYQGVNVSFDCDVGSEILLEDVNITCPQSLKRLPDKTGKSERCWTECPHPMYTSNEYMIQKWIYLIPGIINIPINLILLWDCIITTIATMKGDRQAQIKAKQPTFVFCFVGSIIVFLNSIIGPTLVLVYGSNLPCALPAFSDAFKDNNPCLMNRASIYFVMALFNVIAVNISFLYKKIKDSTNMKTSQENDWIHTKLLLSIGIIIPIVLCIIMFTMDTGNVNSEDFNGQVARYGWLCGPRLEPIYAFTIVYFPFALTGLYIAIYSLLARHVLNKVNSSSSKHGKSVSSQASSTTNSTSSRSSNKSLVSLMRRLNVLGIVSTIIAFLYIITTVTTLPNIKHVATMFTDWSLCLSAGADGILKTAGSCNDLYQNLKMSYSNTSATIDDIKNLPAGDIFQNLSDRPSNTSQVTLFFAQALIPMLFSIIYYILSKSKKGKSRTTKASGQVAPGTAVTTSTMSIPQ